MAGSYNHCVNDQGQLLSHGYLAGMLDSDGDVYEAIEELYGMVWYLAGGSDLRVEEARSQYQTGLSMSPGVGGA